MAEIATTAHPAHPSHPSHPKILIVEDEDDLREILCFAVESQVGVETIEAPSGNRAIEIIKTNPDIVLVICDMRMRDGDGTVVYRFLKDRRLEIPYLICSADPPELHPEISGPPCVGYVQKPFQMKLLTDQIETIIGTEMSAATDAKYCRIRSSLVLKAGRLACNLYVKLSDAKYVKLLSAGEQLNDEDVTRYSQRQVGYLYVPASESVKLLEQLTRDLRAIGRTLMTSPISATVQDMLVIENSTLEVIHELGQKLGFTQEVSELTWASVDFALKAVQKTTSIRELFTKRMCEKSSYISAHSVMLAHVACGIAPLAGFASDDDRHALTLAAFLHDLALDDERLARVRTIAELRTLSVYPQPAVIAKLEQHPLMAARFAREVKGASAATAELIEMHHEQPDGRGFPKGLKSDQLKGLAVVFNFAHDLVDNLITAEERDQVETPEAFLSRRIREYPAGPFRDLATKVMKSL